MNFVECDEKCNGQHDFCGLITDSYFSPEVSFGEYETEPDARASRLCANAQCKRELCLCSLTRILV
jgi:hypothetical protein